MVRIKLKQGVIEIAELQLLPVEAGKLKKRPPKTKVPGENIVNMMIPSKKPVKEITSAISNPRDNS